MEVEQRPLSAPDYTDNNVSVRCIPLYPEVEVEGLDKSIKKASLTQPRPASPLWKKSNGVDVCFFIGKITDKPGMLLMTKCVEHGVPPGPLLAKLKDGFDVKLSDGRTVKASDVKLPDSLGPLFLVVECPSSEYLHPLINHPVLSSYQREDISEDLRIKIAVHFSPPEMIRDRRYQEWMKKFGHGTTHLVANHSNSNPNYQAPYRIQAMLNMLEDSIFPLLPDQRPMDDKVSAQAPCSSNREGIIGDPENENPAMKGDTGNTESSLIHNLILI